MADGDSEQTKALGPAVGRATIQIEAGRVNPPGALQGAGPAITVSLRDRLELLAQRVADFYFMLVPRLRPSAQALLACKLVSHRGEHDNRRVRENTLAAFQAAADTGVWGIEFDVCWSRDLEPFVIHDATTGRVFGTNLSLAEVSVSQLRRAIPEIPTLEEVVATFGGKLHMMIELKRDRLGQDNLKAARLAEILDGLAPVRDYHFLALQPDLFSPVEFAGLPACLLVAELQAGDFSQEVIDQDYGGLCGHYLLLNDRMLRRHHAHGQQLGTGFVTSRYCLYRELNRGTDWIFTNHASKLVAIRERLLGRR